MPIYNYKCKNCGFDFDSFVKIEDRDLPSATLCPKCGEYEITRVPTKSNFKINGYSEANGYSKKV